ncbi:hypothetical protein [Nitrosomonas sp. Nm33]|uniref:hypothetical protein n=1 Tax=Nitrosomonas sp. Nm33 TaxID=133724 RepID=UPI00089945F1|nr:hypothetical protein [Nitrosomonas sp. Nm33]SDY40245.1 hypothetical protein SAMN05421755_102039 [Nitrosomonas sp. Nm33]
MKPNDLLLRCYANKNGDQWQAFCIDFGLAAQGDSFDEVKGKLNLMVKEYLYDALYGEDKAFAEQLLKRKAPFKQIATYYFILAMKRFGIFKNGLHRLFKDPIPLVPKNYVHG